MSAGEHAPRLQDNAALIAALARLQPGMHIAPDLAAPDKAVTLAVGGVTVYLPLADLVDLAAERARLSKEIQALENLIQRGESLLANPGFTGKAPSDVVERERAKLVELNEKRGQLIGASCCALDAAHPSVKMCGLGWQLAGPTYLWRTLHRLPRVCAILHDISDSMP